MSIAHRVRTCLAVFACTSLIVTAPSLMAQARGEVTGTVTSADGTPVAFALVTAANTESSYRLPAGTDMDGTYRFNLPSGNYNLRFESRGYKTVEILAANVRPLSTLVKNCELKAAEQAPNNTGAQPPQQTLPAASSKPQGPSLEDLGITPSQAKGSAREQALLDKRTHMLKIHQRLGLITIAPLVATIIASSMAGGRHATATGRDVHGALGTLTAGMYFTTAYFAIRAPTIPGTATRGPIRLHKALAWIHGPGMILTPILGAMAFNQESNGQKVHGIAKAHGAVADITYTAFGLAVLSVTIKF